MWASMRKWVAYPFLTGVLLSLCAGGAAASQCSDVYDGARRGSPPDWTWWGFGGACHVQWQVKGAGDEQKKSALCRRTSGGSYFIHFDSDPQRSRVTCIFSYPDGGAVAEASTPVDKQDSIGKSDFAAAIETNPTQSEPAVDPQLLKPASVETDSSQVVPKPVAKKVVALAVPIPRISGLDKKIEDKPPTDIEPAATSYDDPDPSRLAATVVCSSLALGNQTACLNAPVRNKDGTYVVTRRAGCTGGLIAAIRTTDSKGRCVRKVVQFAANHRRSEPISSNTPPTVLDAVLYRDSESFACYARRHSEISCDGRINYSPKLASKSEPAIRKAPASEPVVRRKKFKPTAAQTFFAKVKTLFQ